MRPLHLNYRIKIAHSRWRREDTRGRCTDNHLLKQRKSDLEYKWSYTKIWSPCTPPNWLLEPSIETPRTFFSNSHNRKNQKISHLIYENYFDIGKLRSEVIGCHQLCGKILLIFHNHLNFPAPEISIALTLSTIAPLTNMSRRHQTHKKTSAYKKKGKRHRLWSQSVHNLLLFAKNSQKLFSNKYFFTPKNQIVHRYIVNWNLILFI